MSTTPVSQSIDVGLLGLLGVERPAAHQLAISQGISHKSYTNYHTAPRGKIRLVTAGAQVTFVSEKAGEGGYSLSLSLELVWN